MGALQTLLDGLGSSAFAGNTAALEHFKNIAGSNQFLNGYDQIVGGRDSAIQKNWGSAENQRQGSMAWSALNQQIADPNNMGTSGYLKPQAAALNSQYLQPMTEIRNNFEQQLKQLAQETGYSGNKPLTYGVDPTAGLSGLLTKATTSMDVNKYNDFLRSIGVSEDQFMTADQWGGGLTGVAKKIQDGDPAARLVAQQEWQAQRNAPQAQPGQQSPWGTWGQTFGQPYQQNITNMLNNGHQFGTQGAYSPYSQNPQANPQAQPAQAMQRPMMGGKSQGVQPRGPMAPRPRGDFGNNTVMGGTQITEPAQPTATPQAPTQQGSVMGGKFGRR